MSVKNVMEWTKVPSRRVLERTVEALEKRNFWVILLDNRSQALDKLKELIPAGAEVMTGSSTTLYEIGFMDYYISDATPWKCLGPRIYREEDKEKEMELRRKSDTAEYFLGSVNALTEDGQLVAVDQSGSRVSAYPFAAKNVILVVGYQKITRNLEEAMRRIKEYVFYLENERAKKRYKVGTSFGKWVIIEREIVPHRITILLVKEPLGF